MIACTSTTWDRLAGCEVRCILQAGHEVYHTDGCGMTWSKPSAAPPQPSPYSAPEETELQRVTRERDEVQAGLTTLGAILEAIADRMTAEESAQVAQVMAKAARQRDDLREAARAAVEALSKKPVYVGTCHVCMAFATQEAPVEVPLCDGCAGDHGESSDLPHGATWRRLVGMVRP